MLMLSRTAEQKEGSINYTKNILNLYTLMWQLKPFSWIHFNAKQIDVYLVILMNVFPVAELVFPPADSLQHRSICGETSGWNSVLMLLLLLSLSGLTPCRQYEPLRNSLMSWSSVSREMWVVPTATWLCPPTVMGLWVEVKASSFVGGASCWDIISRKMGEIQQCRSCFQSLVRRDVKKYQTGLKEKNKNIPLPSGGCKSYFILFSPLIPGRASTLSAYKEYQVSHWVLIN